MNIAVVSNRFTIVPDNIFDIKNSRKLLGFNHHLSQDDKEQVDELKHLGQVLIYPVSTRIVDLLNDTFKNLSHYNSVTPILLGKADQKPSQKLEAVIWKDSLDIISANNKEVICCNNFGFRLPEDLVYYLTLTIDQLGWDVEQAQISVSGQVKETDRNYTQLGRYLSNVSIKQEITQTILCDELKTVSNSQHYNLFSLAACES